MNVPIPARRRGWPRVLALLTVAVVLIVLAAATFTLSYSGIHVIALRSGVPPRLARVYPGLLDAALVIACVAAVMLRDGRWWARGYAWLAILVIVAVGAATDALHAMNLALPHRRTAGVVAAAPWVLLLLAFSLWLTALRQPRSRRARRPAPAPEPSTPLDAILNDTRAPARPAARVAEEPKVTREASSEPDGAIEPVSGVNETVAAQATDAVGETCVAEETSVISDAGDVEKASGVEEASAAQEITEANAAVADVEVTEETAETADAHDAEGPVAAQEVEPAGETKPAEEAGAAELVSEGPVSGSAAESDGATEADAGIGARLVQDEAVAADAVATPEDAVATPTPTLAASPSAPVRAPTSASAPTAKPIEDEGTEVPRRVQVPPRPASRVRDYWDDEDEDGIPGESYSLLPAPTEAPAVSEGPADEAAAQDPGEDEASGDPADGYPAGDGASHDPAQDDTPPVPVDDDASGDPAEGGVGSDDEQGAEERGTPRARGTLPAEVHHSLSEIGQAPPLPIPPTPAPRLNRLRSAPLSPDEDPGQRA